MKNPLMGRNRFQVRATKIAGHEEIQYACGDRKYRANQTL